NSFNYDYDGNGNLTNQSLSLNGQSNNYSYSYDPLNRIATSSQFNETYAYNNRGNRLSLQSDKAREIPAGETNYTYDAWNRLTQVAKPGGGTVSYRYNGDGLLYERTENSTTVRYYYDGDQVVAEGIVASGSVTMKAQYIRGKGLIARKDANGKNYYLHNGHGDVIELRDSTGNTSVNRYTYDLWGNPLTTTEGVENPFRYSGEMWDQSAGLQ
ncbi:wall-associated protein WapA, partial [Paenibacillus oenotherae]|nr:wall-associated protein WapA [Paenibacillus oenotherae]